MNKYKLMTIFLLNIKEKLDKLDFFKLKMSAHQNTSFYLTKQKLKKNEWQNNWIVLIAMLIIVTFMI